MPHSCLFADLADHAVNGQNQARTHTLTHALYLNFYNKLNKYFLDGKNTKVCILQVLVKIFMVVGITFIVVYI